jgi:hypothetical protein
MSDRDLLVIFEIGLFISICGRGVNGDRAEDLGSRRRIQDPGVTFGGIQCSYLTLITIKCETTTIIY